VIEVLFLAIALSMDAFAVSIGLGAKCKTSPVRLALMAGAYFGVFQALMPLLGYFGGRGVLGWFEAYAPWIAFILLVIVGGKMIIESFDDGLEPDVKLVTHRVMLMLAVATSIDAMAAGFALPLIDFDPLLACVLIGLTTWLFSCLGVFVGVKSGTMLESKAEVFGGVVLILIGFKILLE
jgi:manganese efflux pump family protein